MPIPNTLTRSLDLTHPQEAVWAALTTLDGLTSWFGSSADGEIRPGADVLLRWAEHDGFEKTITVQAVEPMHLFAWTWPVNGAPADDPRRTYVEFSLEPTAGGTRLTVTETGFAQLPDAWLDSSYHGNTEGWRTELDKLPAYLDAAA